MIAIVSGAHPFPPQSTIINVVMFVKPDRSPELMYVSYCTGNCWFKQSVRVAYVRTITVMGEILANVAVTVVISL